MIPIYEEPIMFAGAEKESCAFCEKETSFWHRPTNMPCCPICAKTRTVGEIRDKRLNLLAEVGRK